MINLKNPVIPYSTQFLDNIDIQNVIKVLKSKNLTQGPVSKEFEKKLIKYCNSKYAILFNSATSALHVACLSLGLKKGDTLWTSPISFVASANCALYCSANVDFVDIDLKTFNLDINLLEEKLKKTKKKPKIVVPVHLGGNPCDLEKLKYLSKKFKFKVVEDASHALGSNYKSSKIGSCKFSDVTVFSFHPVKTITSGEGGAALCNNQKLYKLMKSYSTHGIIQNKKNFQKSYDQKYLGYNYRLSDIHSALGVSQLNKLQKFTYKRNKIAKYYINKISENKIDIAYQSILKKNYSSYHLFIIRTKNKKKLLLNLKKNNFYTPTHYMPIYKHSYYKKFNFNKKNFLNSELYFKEAISLPIFYDLDKNKINKVLEILKKYG